MIDDESLAAFRLRVPPARLAGGYGPRSPAELTGEHRLMLAILEDAVVLYVKSLCDRTVTQYDASRAWAWLKSRDRSSPFAFECICDLLDLDSSYIRRGLLMARARPAETVARLAARYSGRPSGSENTGPRRDQAERLQGSVTDVAPAKRARLEPARRSSDRRPPP
jgi:hypothetical protein